MLKNLRLSPITPSSMSLTTWQANYRCENHGFIGASKDLAIPVPQIVAGMMNPIGLIKRINTIPEAKK